LADPRNFLPAKLSDFKYQLWENQAIQGGQRLFLKKSRLFKNITIIQEHNLQSKTSNNNFFKLVKNAYLSEHARYSKRLL